MKQIILFISILALNIATSSAATDDEQFRQDFLAGKISWSEVEKHAQKEGKVKFYHWGGLDRINAWVDNVAIPAMAKKGIQMKSVRSNPKDAIDLILAEKSLGRKIGEGSVDLVWINGENFANLKRNKALFGRFVTQLPNAKNFELNPNDSRSLQNLRDFGVTNNATEAPWSGEQYVCSYNSATLKGSPPKTFADLKSFLAKNPGRFTYVKPPNWAGNTFVQMVLYAHTPTGKGAESFQQSAKEIGATEFARRIKPGMDYLRAIEPLLLGAKNDRVRYPATPPELDGLFANQEIDIACQFGYYIAAVGLASGNFPEAGKQFIFPVKNMIKNKNFLAIPSNAPNSAAALVLINWMMSVEAQASKLKIAGMPVAVDLWKLNSADVQKIKDAAPKLIGVTDEELANNAVSDTNATLVDIIENVWLEYIERKSNKPFETIVKKAYAELGY